MKITLSKVFKDWFKYLVYISLVFVVIALVKADYLMIPVIYNHWYFVLSLLLLFAGFIFQGLNWFVILKKTYPIRIRDAITSVGLSIFAKYIPGKVLVIIGKAGYIEKKYPYSKKSLIARSLDAQFIVLWTGLIIGSLGLFFADETIKWAMPILTGGVVLTLIIFTNIFHNLLKRTIRLIFKKNANIPLISYNEVVKVLPVYLIYWLLFTAGFFFLSKSITADDIHYSTAFAFPLAATLGIIMLIAPGGIGFREGILVAYLTALGMDLIQATTISIISRLWFLCGEGFIFFTALFLNILNSSKK